MSGDIVRYIIIDKEQDVEITSEYVIENKNVLYDNEETLRPNHSIVSRGRERLVWYYNKIHLTTPYHYLVQFYSAELRKDQLLLEDNMLGMKNFRDRKKAYFSLGAALLCIEPFGVFITARSSAIVRCVVDGKDYYERQIEGRWERV